jgi:hypothetical protein
MHMCRSRCNEWRSRPDQSVRNWIAGNKVLTGVLRDLMFWKLPLSNHHILDLALKHCSFLRFSARFCMVKAQTLHDPLWPFSAVCALRGTCLPSASTSGRIAGSSLKGTIGDAQCALPCACGQNIRIRLARCRAWLVWIVNAILNPAKKADTQYQTAIAV